MTIETNYNLGQYVYFMDENIVHCAKVISVNIEITELSQEYVTTKIACKYTLDYRGGKNGGLKVLNEDVLYPSKEDLLKSL
jgi:hypothetical protein